MSEISSFTFADVFANARPLLNDVAAAIYTNTVLLPFGALAHGEVQDEFAVHGIPIVETIADDMAYTAGDSDIPIPSGIADEFQAPLEMWERASSAGSSGVWYPMSRVARIPAPYPNQLGFLGVWEWRNGEIIVLPCNNDRDIFCRYRRQLLYPTGASETGGEGFYWPLVYGTAFQAASATGRQDIASNLEPQYRKRTLDGIRVASRDRQELSFRQQSIRGQGNLNRWPYTSY